MLPSHRLSRQIKQKRIPHTSLAPSSSSPFLVLFMTRFPCVADVRPACTAILGPAHEYLNNHPFGTVLYIRNSAPLNLPYRTVPVQYRAILPGCSPFSYCSSRPRHLSAQTRSFEIPQLSNNVRRYSPCSLVSLLLLPWLVSVPNWPSNNHVSTTLRLGRWAMSQHAQQNDGLFNAQFQFSSSLDSPTIGRTQNPFSANNSSPTSELAKRFANSITLPFWSRHETCTYKELAL